MKDLFKWPDDVTINQIQNLFSRSDSVFTFLQQELNVEENSKKKKMFWKYAEIQMHFKLGRLIFSPAMLAEIVGKAINHWVEISRARP